MCAIPLIKLEAQFGHHFLFGSDLYQLSANTVFPLLHTHSALKVLTQMDDEYAYRTQYHY